MFRRDLPNITWCTGTQSMEADTLPTPASHYFEITLPYVYLSNRYWGVENRCRQPTDEHLVEICRAVYYSAFCKPVLVQRLV